MQCLVTVTSKLILVIIICPGRLRPGLFFMRWSFGEGKKYMSDIRLSMAISDYEYTRDLVHGVVS